LLRERRLFLNHRDYYISVTSNWWQTFVDSILCAAPGGRLYREPATGGETLIFSYPSETGVADVGGEKHILTANLWATRKQASNLVLFVTFPPAQANQQQDRHDEDDKDDGDDTAQAAMMSLQHSARQDTSYALPVDSLKGTTLEAYVRFVNNEQNDQELPTVVTTYHFTDFSFEALWTVAKILKRSYVHVHEEEIGRHAECIEFFGPFFVEKYARSLVAGKGARQRRRQANLTLFCPVERPRLQVAGQKERKLAK